MDLKPDVVIPRKKVHIEFKCPECEVTNSKWVKMKPETSVEKLGNKVFADCMFCDATLSFTPEELNDKA